jgi:hypothetical protein
MTFEEALKVLRAGGEISRKNWRCVLHIFRIAADGQHMEIFREWPSGFVSLYEPLIEDILADDWEAACFPDSLGKGAYTGAAYPPSQPSVPLELD